MAQIHGFKLTFLQKLVILNSQDEFREVNSIACGAWHLENMRKPEI